MSAIPVGGRKRDLLLNRKIWSCKSCILLEFVNCSIRIYNEKTHVHCKVTEGKVDPPVSIVLINNSSIKFINIQAHFIKVVDKFQLCKVGID